MPTEWVARDAEGGVIGTAPFEAGFYQMLCVNTPYREFLKEHTAEVLETFPVDGLFFDIVWPIACACCSCREKMSAAGLDPTNENARERFGLETVNGFKQDMTRFVRTRNPDCTIFYNAGHIGPRHRLVKAAYSHFELESLPSGDWGYLHFPVTRDLNGNLIRSKVFERHDYCEYLLPKGAIGHGLPQTEHAMYRRGMAILADADAEVLAPMVGSFFDRTYRHFCSHRQTPSSGVEVQPGIVRKGRCIYFSSPIFSQYNDNAPRWCKRLVLNALNLLLPDPLVKHNGPSTLQLTLTAQVAQGRWILHLLHFIPERRSDALEVIEDVIPLFKLKVWVKAPAPVREVAAVPEEASLTYRTEEPYAVFELERIDGHAMISLTFG
jgi:Hypothetical glycosyl hydrolase 6